MGDKDSLSSNTTARLFAEVEGNISSLMCMLHGVTGTVFLNYKHRISGLESLRSRLLRLKLHPLIDVLNASLKLKQGYKPAQWGHLGLTQCDCLIG